MTTSPARKQFKKLFGQSNHFLITALAGLSGIEQRLVTTLPPEIHAAWNPHDAAASASRTKMFLFGSFLGSAVDALDMYFTLIYKDPKLVRKPEAVTIYSDAGRSIHKKVMGISPLYNVSAATLALIDVLICWRNNALHWGAENKIESASEKALNDYAANIGKEYCGLDVAGLPNKAAKGAKLSFKETTSLIRAAHNFVLEVDGKLLAELDVAAFCEETLIRELKQTDSLRAKYFLFTGARREALVCELLTTKGISQVAASVIKTLLQIQKTKLQ